MLLSLKLTRSSWRPTCQNAATAAFERPTAPRLGINPYINKNNIVISFIPARVSPTRDFRRWLKMIVCLPRLSPSHKGTDLCVSLVVSLLPLDLSYWPLLANRPRTLMLRMILAVRRLVRRTRALSAIPWHKTGTRRSIQPFDPY